MQPSLFDTTILNKHPLEANKKISERKIIQPLKQIVQQTSPIQKRDQVTTNDNLQTLKNSLDVLFPEQQYEEKDVKRTKQILGDIAEEFTEDELKDTVAKIQFLANSWLDDFERKVFDGVTLKELLHEKGGVK